MDERTVLAMFAGLGVLIGILFSLMVAHERGCRRRWEKLMEEHGEMRAKISMRRKT